tara:strand:- start:1371 stop:1562 length:192 start_codon:yes stop_codon:yes gene_type:complete
MLILLFLKPLRKKKRINKNRYTAPKIILFVKNKRKERKNRYLDKTFHISTTSWVSSIGSAANP